MLVIMTGAACFSKILPIVPALLCSMLFDAHYAPNYASIIGSSLLGTHSDSNYQVQQSNYRLLNNMHTGVYAQLELAQYLKSLCIGFQAPLKAISYRVVVPKIHDQDY